ncbi:MAG: hypothetical protein WA971_10095, partial [Microbacterium sp.]
MEDPGHPHRADRAGRPAAAARAAARDATFRFTAGHELLAVPDVVLPGTATAWVAVVIAAAITV